MNLPASLELVGSDDHPLAPAAVPVWFGPQDQPLFGWWHEPSTGTARAGVVLCPPLGTEGANASNAYRKLAQRLQSLGVAVLRFDYAGTGDSSGTFAEGECFTAWRAGIREAIAFTRARSVPSIALVGMRAGAVLASFEAEDDGAIDALVLWDPSVSVRSNLREQHALYCFVVDDSSRRLSDEGEALATLGFAFPADAAASLSAASLSRTTGPLARRVLIATRADRTPNRELVRRFDSANVEWIRIDQQEALLATADPANATVAEIAKWLSTVSEAAPSSISPVVTEATAVVARDDEGRAVIERPVRLGPEELFGMITEREGGSEGPTVLLFNSGVNDHMGPGRMWVDVARAWAVHGVRTARVDLSGVGESPVRPGQLERVVYAPEAIFDVENLAAAVSPGDPSNVVLIGICAGAYTAIEGAIRLAARAVCAVNPVLTFVPAERWSGAPDPGRQAVRSKRWWLRTPFATSSLARRLKPKIPTAVWWIADRLGIQPSPAGGFEVLVDRGVETMVVCDERDAGPYRERASWVLRRLLASGMFRFEIFQGLDHLLYSSACRDYVRRLLDEQILRIASGAKRRTNA